MASGLGFRFWGISLLFSSRVWKFKEAVSTLGFPVAPDLAKLSLPTDQLPRRRYLIDRCLYPAEPTFFATVHTNLNIDDTASASTLRVEGHRCPKSSKSLEVPDLEFLELQVILCRVTGTSL